MTVQELASQALTFLTRGDRLSEHTGEKIVTRTDNAPEWVYDLCKAAHGEFGPDDYRYEFLRDCLIEMEEGSDEDHVPDLDSLYPYTHDRLRWLASHLDRPGICDEAAENYGRAADMVGAVSLGMAYEIGQVYRLVWEFLTERAEELNAETVEQD